MLMLQIVECVLNRFDYAEEESIIKGVLCFLVQFIFSHGSSNESYFDNSNF